MRDILFRGKRLQGNDWVYGYFFKSDFNKRERESGKATLIFTPDCETFIMVPEWHNSLMVHADTVGQYTGLMDKNGVKIFEGDIVMTDVRYDKPYSKSRKGKRLIGKVEHHIGEGKGFFNDDTGKYDAHKMYSSEWKVTIPNTESNRKYCCYTWGDFFDCEVIGNVYDNPELLEEE